MSEVASTAVRFTGAENEVIDWLRANNVERVRVEWCDYGGIARGKAMDVTHFQHALDHGIAFCAAAMAFDIGADVVPGTDFAESIGYGDFVAKPDLSSLRLLRHEADTAVVMGTLHWPDGRPVEGDPRNVLHRVVARMAEMGFDAACAPEFEFYLCDANHALLDEGLQCYSMQKRTEFLAEEYALLDAAAAHGQLECSHYEWGPGQYEVSIRHQRIRRMADDGHLFRASMKEAAMQMDRRVTFMAKPFDGKTGNSCHIHLSLVRPDGSNAFAAPDLPLHINDTCRHFIGGVLARLTELTALFFPNSNSYRRLVPGVFAPISLAWGVDNRTASIRLINETPAGTRPELRVCGGDINIYIAFAAYLAAGLDGIANQTDPGAPAEGDLDEQDVTRLPDDWGSALSAFEGSDWAKEWFGEEFCRNYAIIKRHEYDAFRRTVPGSERARYVEWL
jgi:glutamine synthetase